MASLLDVGPLAIAEPATMLTDYLMACLAIWFAWDLGRRAVASCHARWWSRGFLFLAASSLVGGTFHGLQGSLPPWLAVGLWRATLVAAVISSFATMRAVALQWLVSERRNLWTSVAVVKLAVCVLVGALHPVFLVVIADFGLTMLFAAGVLIASRARSPRAALALATGIALFLVGAVIQQTRLSPHPAFNHNDLFHGIQILGNTCFFLSARLGLATASTPPTVTPAVPARRGPTRR